MSTTFYGVNFHWGLGATTVTVTNATGIYQNITYARPADKLETKDQRNNIIAVQYTNPVEKLTLEYLLSDANPATGSAALTIGTSMPDTGTEVSITTADTPISGAHWKVDAPDYRATNTSNASITLQLTRYVGF